MHVVCEIKSTSSRVGSSTQQIANPQSLTSEANDRTKAKIDNAIPTARPTFRFVKHIVPKVESNIKYSIFVSFSLTSQIHSRVRSNPINISIAAKVGLLGLRIQYSTHRRCENKYASSSSAKSSSSYKTKRRRVISTCKEVLR